MKAKIQVKGEDRVIRNLVPEKQVSTYAFIYENWERILMNNSLRKRESRKENGVIPDVISFGFNDYEWNRVCKEIGKVSRIFLVLLNGEMMCFLHHKEEENVKKETPKKRIERNPFIDVPIHTVKDGDEVLMLLSDGRQYRGEFEKVNRYAVYLKGSKWCRYD